MRRIRVQIGPNEHKYVDAPDLPGVAGKCSKCPSGKTTIKPSWELIPGLSDPLAAPNIPPRDKFISFFRYLLDKEIPPPQVCTGDGIVICGGGEYWAMVVILICSIREYTGLPIQVWHRADEVVYPDQLKDLEGITYHVADTYPHRRLVKWEVKTIALINCGWEKVFIIDSDTYLVGDPSPLIALSSRESPFMFWEDLHVQEHRIKWEAFGLIGSNGVPPIQGGHLVIHRREFWRELVLTHWLNQHSDYSYEFGYGDQDTYRIVLAATNSPYRYLGKAEWSSPSYVCRFNNLPLIVHYCQSKIRIPDLSYLPDWSKSIRHLGRVLSLPLPS